MLHDPCPTLSLFAEAPVVPPLTSTPVAVPDPELGRPALVEHG